MFISSLLPGTPISSPSPSKSEPIPTWSIQSGSDMVDMTDRIAQGRFFGIFVDESFGRGISVRRHLVRRAPSVVRPSGCADGCKARGQKWGGDDRVGACFKCVIKGTWRHARYRPIPPVSFIFADDFFPERTEAVPFRVSSC